ncbi:MAG: DUF2490 domain-containing protein [Saprospiraceae bacterium]|nr:DUF2490 domain-containing protein [Saprospiraceae bacterium]
MTRFYFSILFVCSIFIQALAQSNGLGSWNIINLKYTTKGPWSFFAEAQLRSLHFYNDFHYHEFKGGVQFQMTPDMQVALAAGKYDTYKEGGDFVLPKNNDEIRIWPQIALVQKIGRFKFEHRYRAEFRFTNNGFKKRFRSRVGLSYPIKSTSVFIPTSAGFSNELFSPIKKLTSKGTG